MKRAVLTLLPRERVRAAVSEAPTSEAPVSKVPASELPANEAPANEAATSETKANDTASKCEAAANEATLRSEAAATHGGSTVPAELRFPSSKRARYGPSTMAAYLASAMKNV